MPAPETTKSLESWLWDAACSIRGAKDAPKFKDYILPLVFTKRLCDVFDDEINRIAKEVGSRAKAFKLVKADKKLVRFYLPLVPKNPDDSVWSVIRTGSDATRPADDKYQEKLGQEVTTYMRAIADANPLLKGIVDRIDFNATTHGQRDIDDLRLSNLIEAISGKRLGLTDVEGDIIGRSYEYLIRKFAEGGGQSAGEFYTPGEVGTVMARIMDPEPGMEGYDPTCGSAGLIIKLEAALEEKMKAAGKKKFAPLKLYGQEFTATTWAMANMNMIIHDMEGKIEIGDTFRNPKLREGTKLRTFDRVVANPMWNQTEFKEADYDADELGRFPKGAGFPGSKADWGWMQHILASLKPSGRAAVVLDTGAASRGSGNANSNKEKDVRQWFIQQDLIEGVIYLPENLFYNTTAPGIIIVLNKAKPKSREGLELFCSMPAASSPRATPRTSFPTTPSPASPTPSSHGGRWTNTAASSPSKRSPRTTTTSPPAATSTPAPPMNTARWSRSSRNWTN
jgi:type I restriction enzyme M protein